MWITVWAGCADIGAAVARTMAILITPTSASKDITATPTRSAAGTVAGSLTYRFCQSKRKVIVQNISLTTDDCVGHMWLTFWAGCADIRAAVAITMARFITPASATRDVTTTPTRSAARSVTRSLTCCRIRSYRRVGKTEVI